jgi:hypothetical protein
MKTPPPHLAGRQGQLYRRASSQLASMLPLAARMAATQGKAECWTHHCHARRRRPSHLSLSPPRLCAMLAVRQCHRPRPAFRSPPRNQRQSRAHHHHRRRRRTPPLHQLPCKGTRISPQDRPRRRLAVWLGRTEPTWLPRTAEAARRNAPLVARACRGQHCLLWTALKGAAAPLEMLWHRGQLTPIPRRAMCAPGGAANHPQSHTTHFAALVASAGPRGAAWP